MHKLFVALFFRVNTIPFDMEFDIGESYLYGVAIGDAGRYAINLQGGSTMVVVPRDLLAELPYVNKAGPIEERIVLLGRQKQLLVHIDLHPGGSFGFNLYFEIANYDYQLKCACCGAEMAIDQELEKTIIYKCRECGLSNSILKNNSSVVEKA